MNFDEIKNKIDEDIDNYENGMDSIIGVMIKRQEIRDNQIEKIQEFLYSIPENKLESFMNEFIRWEEKYEERKYSEGISTQSILFSNVICAIRCLSNYKIDRYDLDEDFLDEEIKWKGYSFKLYQGQGCFWRIEKNNKIIFQSN